MGYWVWAVLLAASADSPSADKSDPRWEQGMQGRAGLALHTRNGGASPPGAHRPATGPGTAVEPKGFSMIFLC